MAEPKQTNKERLREITESIEQGIKELFESEKYMQYLRVMSRFHRYSVNNITLIHLQKPHATHVAGFNKWRDQFGRHVKRGEKGIKIIAPTPYKKKIEEIKLQARLEAEAVDVTIPGIEKRMGHKHPMYLALDEIKDIFVGMGFTILDGPEVELSYYNFDRLNAEEGHPSRDWSDTFYFDKDSRVMLRSQTSPMQVHAMETKPLPIRILAPGRVYRKDEVDATHSPMFHQVEGMVIDKNITMADLKGTLNAVMEQLYGEGTKTRFRPHHFPFTEPSCEMDVQCHKCGGVGCPTCKGEGWIEVLGAGMIHPKVLEMSGIDPEVYSGWAFGMGLERMAMRRFKIADLRLIFENDVRFLEQF